VVRAWCTHEPDAKEVFVVTGLEEDIKILEAGLKAYTDEYREQADIWKTLESKAQVAITVSGVFLAATFAFVHQAALVCIERLLVVVTLLSLLTSLIMALRVLQIREHLMPVDGALFVRRAKELVDPMTPRSSPGERYMTLMSELGEDSEEVLKVIESANERKRSDLNWANGLIIVSGVAATAAAVVELFGRP
jgi:hypothetical protein